LLWIFIEYSRGFRFNNAPLAFVSHGKLQIAMNGDILPLKLEIRNPWLNTWKNGRKFSFKWSSISFIFFIFLLELSIKCQVYQCDSYLVSMYIAKIPTIHLGKETSTISLIRAEQYHYKFSLILALMHYIYWDHYFHDNVMVCVI